MTSPRAQLRPVPYTSAELTPTPDAVARLDALVDQRTRARLERTGVTDQDLIDEIRANVRRQVYRSYRPYAASRAFRRRKDAYADRLAQND